MILAGNLLQARSDQTILKNFQNTSFMVTKLMVKVRKRMDRTTAFRRTIAPVDDMTARCNASCGMKRGRAAKHRNRASERIS